MPETTAPSVQAFRQIDDFESLIAYFRDELDWEIPELAAEKLTYSYTADELGLKLDAKVDIKQLRPILGRKHAWGVFFVDFDKAELPVTLLRRLLSGVSRKKRESANAGERALFDKNDLLFVSAYGKAVDRRLALAHFHQEPGTAALPTLRVIDWGHGETRAQLERRVEQLARLRWPLRGELPEASAARWTSAFIDRPREAIRTSKEMATALAEGAKTIRRAIEEVLPKEKAGEPLPQLFEAVRATLNKDLDVPKFADTYAQTLSYGLLAKRMDQVQRWRAEKARTLNGSLELPPITVEALETALPTNPFLSELLSSFLTAVGRDGTGARLDFDVLGIGDVIHLLNTANIDAVLADFDKNKAGDDPVIHFYEGFLAAYDKAMKVQRGVFYTPKPVVGFIVRSVDEVLRTEFGLKDGFADTTTWGEFVTAHPEAKIPDGVEPDEPFVKILDPATGTGTFLVEVIDLIYRRLIEETWKNKSRADAARLWNMWVPQHLLSRLYGYELMMAPYAVAHMKIGLKLAETGYDFSGLDAHGRPARARVFLTNALEPSHDLDMQLAFMNEALAHEAAAANLAKAKTRFTVVVGNPPYSIKSWNNSQWITDLVEDYKRTVRREESQIQALSNDYIKFIRLAQEHVATSSHGAIGLITGHGYTHGTQARDMRRSLTSCFSKADYLDLHGSVRRLNAVNSDEPVFEIMTGVAVLVAARAPTAEHTVRLHDLTGTLDTKLLTLNQKTARRYSDDDYLIPRGPNHAFRRSEAADFETEYERLPDLSVLFGTGDRGRDKEVRWATGFSSRHDDFAIAFTPGELATNIVALAEADSFEDANSRFSLCSTKHWDFARAKAYAKSESWKDAAVRVAYRPFDSRFTVLRNEIVCELRPLAQQVDAANITLTASRAINDVAYSHALVVDAPPDKIFLSNKTSTNAYAFPLFISSGEDAHSARPNLSRILINRLSILTSLRFDDGSDRAFQARLPGTEPAPPVQNALPLRRERGDLMTTFGPRDVFDWIYAVLHSPEYRTRYAGFLKSDFARVPLPKNRTLFANLVPLGTKLAALHLLDSGGAPELENPMVKFSPGNGEARLGTWGEKKDVRRDPASGRVYISADSWFATVPQGAWEHRIGGYQPAQKWLKDRSQTGSGAKLKPGRVLSDDDILRYRRIIVALAGTAKLQDDIDQVIAGHGGWPEAFRGMAD